MSETISSQQMRDSDLDHAASHALGMVIAVGKYDSNSLNALPAAHSAALRLRDELQKNGYCINFPQTTDGGTAAELGDALEAWFRSADSDSRVFLFWTGHGRRAATRLHLLTKDSPDGISGHRALQASTIAEYAAGTKARKALIIVDACFAGDAIADAIGTLAKELGLQPGELTKRRGFAFIASAHALDRAEQGVLCDILSDLLIDNNAERRWSDEDEYIDFENLVDALIDELDRRQIDQIIQPGAFGATSKILFNPRHRSGLAAEDVETRRWRERLGDHFHYASRGIEVGETGWFFTGRQRLLADIVRWLASAENGLRIVTGPPGSGKSAVLGRLATLSDPSYHALAEKEGILAQAATETIPPIGTIDVAVHAKGKTLDDCARALALRLGIGIKDQSDLTVDVKGLIEAIRHLDRRVTLFIDALDEAQSGHAPLIARGLIIPLSRLPRIRLLLGTRRSLDGTAQSEDQRHAHLRTVFGQKAIIDDLADEAATAQDIADYVSLRLEAHSPHAPDAIAAVAPRVAGKAGDSFLYARVVSRTLQEADDLEIDLPSDALSAFAHDIQTRFGEEAGRVHRLLAALAWGLGKGLTRRIWPKVAEAVSSDSARITDDDISWVLSKAGWYVIETGENGQAVYCLVHQAFADCYREQAKKTGLHEAEVNRRIALALAAGYSGADWLDADGYLARSLATHAASGQVLDALVTDPGFLAIAEPSGLLPHFASVVNEEGQQIAAVYGRAAHLLNDTDAVERMAYIHLQACMEDPKLAPELVPPVRGIWRCRWTRVTPTSPHWIIGRHEAGVNGVALGEIEGQPVIVSVGGDNTIRLWNARSGILQTNASCRCIVEAVALGDLDRQPVIVLGGGDSLGIRHTPGGGSFSCGMRAAALC